MSNSIIEDVAWIDICN